MKKFHKLLCAVLALSMTAAVGVGVAGCNDNVAASDKKTIAVIAKGESHAFWQSVKRGATDAGKKYGYNVTFRGPTKESEDEVPVQREMLTQALNDKSTKGIVLATIGTGFADELVTAYNKGIPVVEFDSGLYNNRADITEGKDPTVSAVASDNFAAAGVAAENFYKAVKPQIEKATSSDKFYVWIIQHDQSQTGIDRAQGFKSKIETLVANDNLKDKFDAKIDAKTNAGGEYKASLQAAEAAKADAVFMCNEGVVNECYPEVADNAAKYKNMLFSGFDAGTNQIEWIKKADTNVAKLVGSVAQDSYNIGYKAVEQAVFAAEKKNVEKKIGIPGTWYDASNIDEMIEKGIVYKG